MATHDDFMNTEPPPPAYELSNAELDRKIADAAQRSLSLQEEQLQRPTLPPIDEDGFPVWSDELFNYNQALRQREAEAHSTKLQSEYTRVSVPVSGSSGSASTSSPPRVQPPSQGLNLKQKEDRLGWYDESSQGIAQDEDYSEPSALNVGRPPSMMYSSPPRTQNLSHSRPPIQVQVGPRPHDVLAQPQSPVSDLDEDEPLPSAGTTANLGRAPTYYPMQAPQPTRQEQQLPSADLGRAPTYHSMRAPEPTRQEQLPPAAATADLGRAPTYHSMRTSEPARQEHQLRRQDTRGSMDSIRSELPAWTAVAPSLEGPAYEEFERRTSQESSRVPSRVASPSGGRPSLEERRQTVDWRPMQARPQIQERVAGVRRSTSAVPYASEATPPPPVPSAPAAGLAAPAARPSMPPAVLSAPAAPHAHRVATSPAPPVAHHAHRSATSPPPPHHSTTYTPSGYAPPSGYTPPVAGRPPGTFDPGVAYRATQQFNFAGGRADSDSGSGMHEARAALREGGASVFYNAAVAATMQKTAPVFKSAAPTRMHGVPEDDAASVFSGMSGGRQGSVHSGGAGARMSVYSGGGGDGFGNRVGFVPPAGGQGFQSPTGGQGYPSPTGAQGYQPGGQGYQPGQTYQPGGYQPAATQGYQPGGQTYQPAAGGYQPGQPQPPPPGAFVPPPPPPGAQPPGQPGYQPGGGRPLPSAPGFAPPRPNAGGFIVPAPNAGFVAPPPPPGVGPGGFVQPGRKPGNKLYKRL